MARSGQKQNGKMSEEQLNPTAADALTLSFGKAFTKSAQFDEVYREGMSLVERTAQYLENEGRHESRTLDPTVSVVYATESMRLTTRLLEVASWLLIQRALKDQEISAEEAERRRSNVNLRTTGRPSHINHFEQLPAGLQELITLSFAFQDRIAQIDRAMRVNCQPAGDTKQSDPVGAQHSDLRAAFSVIPGGRKD